jgi:hypothetical protein
MVHNAALTGAHDETNKTRDAIEPSNTQVQD